MTTERAEDRGSKGFVSLVGAGPGDPSLLTRAACDRLRHADCVIHDHLIDRRLLGLAPSSAERIDVGKRAGQSHRCAPQAMINSLLLERAIEGKRVVRLKGGDPLLFARGAEEALALKSAGIDFEIIPGVTSATAAAATAAIPLTHRGLASAVCFVTGHEDPQKSPAVDWKHLAAFQGTIVIYMGLGRWRELARALIQYGKSPSTRCAIVEWAGSNRQGVTEGLLGDMANQESQRSTPAVILIGDVVGLRDSLAWHERRPLFGRTVLLLRPADQCEDIARRLEQLGAWVLCQPTMTIEPPADWSRVDSAIHHLRDYDWLVFSSTNGVSGFLDRMWRLGFDARQLGPVRLAAIGPATAKELERRQLRADLVPAAFRAEDLVQELSPLAKDSRVLLVRADRGREVLSTGLSKSAKSVETVVVYRQVDVERPAEEVLAALSEGAITDVFFSSGNIARAFFGWLDSEKKQTVLDRARLVSISPVTSEAMRSLGVEPTVEATRYTLDGMVDRLLEKGPTSAS